MKASSLAGGVDDALGAAAASRALTIATPATKASRVCLSIRGLSRGDSRMRRSFPRGRKENLRIRQSIFTSGYFRAEPDFQTGHFGAVQRKFWLPAPAR